MEAMRLLTQEAAAVAAAVMVLLLAMVEPVVQDMP
jgi:hypothetical protein